MLICVYVVCHLRSQLPDQALFDACKDGDGEYVGSVIGLGVEMDWDREFEVEVEGEGSRYQVCYCVFVSV